MSEADKNGQITLGVDQEVFIETVESGHAVEDANVATEVTSFERVGDAYVLEGAIVFAGYLTKSPDIGSVGDPPAINPYARHVHHRMPFTLRVPVQHQPRGVVNVASRISDWQLNVIGEGWLRVQAKLRVSGLNGRHGYHFQCGAQEEGDVLFSKRPSTEETGSDESDANGFEPQVVDSNVGTEEEATGKHFADSHLELVRGQPEFGEDVEKASTDDVSRVSLARGGAKEAEDAAKHERASGAPADGPRSTDAQTNEGPSAREELKSLDRYVQTEASTEDKGYSQTPATDEEVETSEFEFEHQVDAGRTPTRKPEVKASQLERSQSDGNTEEHPQNAAPSAEEESFVASRSFSDEGFQAAAGFVPTVRVGAQQQEPSDESNADEAQGELDSDERSLVDTSLWSFVDFNAPDNYYTLRYVIVMEEESMSTVAERVGCSEVDLMRSNRLSNESVAPGQVLRVPGSMAART